MRLRPRGPQLPLPPDPTRRRAGPDPPDGRRRQGRGDPRAAPPAGGAAPPGRPSPLAVVGSGAHRHVGQAGAAGTVGRIPGDARDDPALAPRPRAPALDLPPPPARSSLAAG